MKLNEIFTDTMELSDKDLQETRAGETLWYWVGYGAGLVAKGFSAYLAGVRYASETMPGLR